MAPGENGPGFRTALILGGARSGKSRYAEGIARAMGRDRVYVATAQAHDDEMARRIEAHVAARGDGWRTMEAPLDLTAALEAEGDVLLVDCLTLWLTNLMLAERDPAAETDRLLASLKAATAPVILVSNEVGLGIVPDNALARRFRDAQGVLNQRIAEQADLVVFMAAGLPLVMKGAAP